MVLRKEEDVTNAFKPHCAPLVEKRLQARGSVHDWVGVVGRKGTEIFESYPVADVKGLVRGCTKD